MSQSDCKSDKNLFHRHMQSKLSPQGGINGADVTKVQRPEEQLLIHNYNSNSLASTSRSGIT